MSRKENGGLYVPIGERQHSKYEIIYDRLCLPPLTELLRAVGITAGGVLLAILVLLISGLRWTGASGEDAEKEYSYFGWIYGGKPALGIMHCSDGVNATVRGWSFYYSDGSSYTGETSGFMKQGSGVLTLADGSVYTGNFKDDLFSDEHATLVFADGGSYEGGFEDGLFSGQGKRVFADGSVYIGSFVKGERSGQGSFTYSNGDSFVGTFDADMRSEGVYKWISGESLDGKYSNNVPSLTEKSVYTDYSGRSYLAYYKDGKITEKAYYVPPKQDEPSGVG